MSKRARCRKHNPSQRRNEEANHGFLVPASSELLPNHFQDPGCLKLPIEAPHCGAGEGGIPLTWLSDA
jgi:hypothetical protein